MSLEHVDTIIAFVVILAGVSLLITVLTQMISDFLGLRGSNLLRGITALLRTVYPQLDQEGAAKIAKAALIHPLISDSILSNYGFTPIGWRLATAIRRDELVGILKQFAQTTPMVAAPGDKPTAYEKAVAGLKSLPKNCLQDLTSLPRNTDIKEWFPAAMDRVSQQFATHARISTIACSILVAFALHLDTLQLLTQLSTDAELRARLVGSAEALTQKADEILASSGNPPAATYLLAMNEFRSNFPALGLPAPAGLTNLPATTNWLDARLRETMPPITNRSEWVDRYVATVPTAILRARADQLSLILTNKLKFQIIPEPYPSVSSYWSPSLRHFWGVLASAALLSLGAPFWFNLLKTLTNLRPLVATKEKEERGHPA